MDDKERKWLEKRAKILRLCIDEIEKRWRRAEEVMAEIENFLAGHWQDDDCPQAEKTFGVRKVFA